MISAALAVLLTLGVCYNDGGTNACPGDGGLSEALCRGLASTVPDGGTACYNDGGTNACPGTPGTSIAALPGTCHACPTCLTDAWNYWSFNNTVVDTLGHNNGTINGSVTYATGVLGQSAVFGGTAADYVGIPPLLLQGLGVTTDPFSVSVWVYPTVLPGSGYGAIIVDGANSAGLYFKSNGSMSWWTFLAGSDHASATSVVAINTWTHVAFTYDGLLWKMYINGSLSGSGSQAGIIGYNLASIGGGGTTPIPYTGRINALATWKKTLTAGEVVLLYNGGAGLPYTSW